MPSANVKLRSKNRLMKTLLIDTSEQIRGVITTVVPMRTTLAWATVDSWLDENRRIDNNKDRKCGDPECATRDDELRKKLRKKGREQPTSHGRKINQNKGGGHGGSDLQRSSRMAEGDPSHHPERQNTDPADGKRMNGKLWRNKAEDCGGFQVKS